MNRTERARAEAPSQRWTHFLVPALVVMAIVVAGLGAWYARSGSTAVDQVHLSRDRADCRTQYAAEMQNVVDARDDIALELSTTFERIQLEVAQGQPSPTVAEIARMNDLSAQLTAARAKERALPDLDLAVEHGFTLDGHHYPPCPGS